MRRPEYITCVARERIDLANKTWCGKLTNSFNFVNIGHAAENGAQNGRLVACPKCVKNIIKALENGNEII